MRSQDRERQVKQHDSFYHQLVQALPCGVIVVNAAGVFCEANPAAESILGMTQAAIGDLTLSEFAAMLVNEDGKPLADADNPVAHCLATAQPQCERTLGIVRMPQASQAAGVRSQGRRAPFALPPDPSPLTPKRPVVWTIFSVVPLFDPHTNHFYGVSISLIDISERQQSEEKLRRSEQFHRLISEISSDYGYSCRIEPDGTTIMDEVTPGFTRVTGYTLEELNAQGGWRSFIHPDDLNTSPVVHASIMRGEAGMTEVRIITKHGRTLWIRFSTRPIWDEKEKRICGLVGAVLDISEHVAAQQELQENAERLLTLSRRLLMVQEAERRRLACELHDEIGQLLTGLELTMASTEKLAPDELRETHSRARRMVRDLTTYIRDMSLRLRPTMLDDLGLLPALLWHFRRCQEHLDLRVHFEHSGLDERFELETETAAFRILQEALTNVARHANVNEVRVHAWRETDRLCLQVADEGRGFDPEAALADGKSTGLSGMRERALLLGGQFTVDSILAPLPVPEEEGNGVREQGTTIYAELPIRGKGD